MNDNEKTYSIALRVRRTIIEDAYIAVPITADITEKKDDGSVGIDVAAFFAAGVRISQDPRVEWQVESSLSEPHPEQRASPEDRNSFDAFHAGEAAPT